MPHSDDLQTSFEFPPKLTFWIDKEYMKVRREAFKKYGPFERLTVEEQLGISFQAAVKSGLLVNWRSKLMPNPDTNDIDSESMIHVIYWVGELAHNWWMERREIPKVSFTRRLITRLPHWMRKAIPLNKSAPLN